MKYYHPCKNCGDDCAECLRETTNILVALMDGAIPVGLLRHQFDKLGINFSSRTEMFDALKALDFVIEFGYCKFTAGFKPNKPVLVIGAEEVNWDK